MCGIVGEYRTGDGPVSPDVVAVMRDSISHRGPDDSGIYVHGPVALGHRRLSILDLTSAGHQPMLGRDGRSAITFNGEIYNYIELRSELAKLGHAFSSDTDTEVLLRLYEEFGEASLAKLNGMFAFAIWDPRRQRLFCARDPLGIKPFYYHFADNRLVFASEVKALLTTPWIAPDADPLALADVLFAGIPLGGKTMFTGIRELPPGHLLVAERSGIRAEPYWQLPFRHDHARSYEDLSDEFRALLMSAVELQCRSDAPLGTHLSSGTDSTLISALASGHRPGLSTFTIRYDDGDRWDESALAMTAARSIGADPRVGTPAYTTFPEDFAAAVWHMDAPLPNAGALAYRSVSQLASSFVKVALTGHGGDEVFAGYPGQFLTAFGHSRPFHLVEGETGGAGASWLTRLATAFRRHGLQGLAGRLGHRFSRRDPHEALWMALHVSGPPQLSAFVSRKFARRIQGYDPTDAYLENFRQVGSDELLDRCLHHDLRTYLPSLLMMEDRASMAFGIESRVPLLDVRIVELLATVPPGQKTDGGRTSKRILRDAARALLPPEIVDRRVKAPFPAPFHQWLEGPLQDWVWRILDDARTLDRGIFHPDVLRERDLSGRELWRVLSVEAWFRTFIDDEPESLPSLDPGRLPTAPHRGR